MARREKKPAPAAYSLIDISELDEDIRKDIIEDANAGGALYGVRVVEESVNGGARAPIYGYYKDGPDAERWEQAKKDFGLTSSEIADGDVATGAGGEVIDPRREAALREAAAQAAEAEADRIRAGEAEAIRSITGDDDDDEGRESSVRGGANSATDSHPTNIVDATLDRDAENEVSDAENQKPAAKPKTKTPR